MALDVGLRSGLSSPLELSDPFRVVPQNLPFFYFLFFLFLGKMLMHGNQNLLWKRSVSNEN